MTSATTVCNPRPCAALFVRKRSHYKQIAGVDCYDSERDALTWRGGVPGVFHPPCRAWGKYKARANPLPGERELALWSIAMVRKFGGVVEHPSSSGLWREAGCLGFGIRDQFGGVRIPVLQSWWGHRAAKSTVLYLVGVAVPDIVVPFGPANNGLVENLCKAERERTPQLFAEWLVGLAQSCKVGA